MVSELSLSYNFVKFWELSVKPTDKKINKNNQKNYLKTMSNLHNMQANNINDDEYDRVLQVNVFLEGNDKQENSPCYKYTIKDNVYGDVENGHRIDD